jgi:hypothetical protein
MATGFERRTTGGSQEDDLFFGAYFLRSFGRAQIFLALCIGDIFFL